MRCVYFTAGQLPAGLITTDGQQQNVMVYTTSYQQVQPSPKGLFYFLRDIFSKYLRRF